MTTIKLITEALLALKDRTGSSVQAINKWIETEKKVRPLVGKLCLFVATRLFGARVFFADGPESQGLPTAITWEGRVGFQ